MLVRPAGIGYSVLLAVILAQYCEKEGSLTAGSQLRPCQPPIPVLSVLAKSSLYLGAISRASKIVTELPYLIDVDEFREPVFNAQAVLYDPIARDSKDTESVLRIHNETNKLDRQRTECLVGRRLS